MATQMDDFTNLFGPEGTEIDFSRPSGKTKYPLPIPEPKDNLDEAIQKMEAIARVVAEGKSAAVCTGDLSATQKGWDAELLSMEAMDHAEKTQYYRWKKGISLPAIDWLNNVITIPSDEASISRYRQLAAAVAVIWDVPPASPENASWIWSNLPYCKPLILAVTRLQENERHLREKMTKLEEYELAESKTIGRVTGVVTDTLNELISRINHAKDILQARQNALHRKEAERKSAKDPIKNQPQVSSDSRLRPTVAYRAQTTPDGEEKEADVKGGVATSLNERLRQVNQAKLAVNAPENTQPKEGEQNGAKDPSKHQPQMSSDPRLKPTVAHCAQITPGGEEKKADMKGGVATSLNERPRQINHAKEAPEARQNAQLKEGEQNGTKDSIRTQPQVSSDSRLKPTVAQCAQNTPDGEEKKADGKGGVAISLNERLKQINQAKLALKAREKAQLKEGEQNGTKDAIRIQPEVSSDPRLRPMVEHCAQVPRGGEEKKADAKGVKEEPRRSSDGKRPRIPSDPRDGPPIDSPRGPKRPAQMGRRGGSSLGGSRV